MWKLEKKILSSGDIPPETFHNITTYILPKANEREENYKTLKVYEVNNKASQESWTQKTNAQKRTRKSKENLLKYHQDSIKCYCWITLLILLLVCQRS